MGFRSPDRGRNPTGEERLSQLVEEYGLPVGLVTSAIKLAPDLVSIPYVNRYEVWAGIGTFAVLVIAVHFGLPRPVVSALALCGVAVVVALAVAGPPGERETARADPQLDVDPIPTPTPRPAITHVGGQPTAMLRALGHRWVLHPTGRIDRLDADGGGVRARLHVTGRAVEIAACAGGLIVTHDNGKVARIDPVSGRVLVDYPYAHDAGSIACGGEFVFVTQPRSGTVVQLRSKTLRYVDAFPLARRIASITFGAGAIWGLNRRAGEVVGVKVRSKELLGPFRIGSRATQILYGGDRYIAVLYRSDSCLTRLDLARGVEVAPAIPLGPFAWRMRRVGDSILVADYGDGSVLAFDVSHGRVLDRTLAVADGRLADADRYDGRLIGLDAQHGRLVALAPVIQGLRQRGSYHRRTGCPE